MKNLINFGMEGALVMSDIYWDRGKSRYNVFQTCKNLCLGCGSCVSHDKVNGSAKR